MNPTRSDSNNNIETLRLMALHPDTKIGVLEEHTNDIDLSVVDDGYTYTIVIDAKDPTYSLGQIRTPNGVYIAVAEPRLNAFAGYILELIHAE